MRRWWRVTAALGLAALSACGGTVEVSGELSPDGSCSATIDGAELRGSPGGVRMASRNFAAEGEEPRYGMVVFCRLTGPEEEPARIDFVKRNAPRDGALDPAIYTINRDGAGPLSIGVIVTAPEYLDPRRSWQPVSGTFVVRSSAPGAMEARFEMELRPAGQRTY